MWALLLPWACTAALDKSASETGEVEIVDPDELRARLAEAGITSLEPPPETPAALVELGILLNADPILSGNQNISCATCHQPALGGDDDRPTAIGQGAEGVGMDRVATYPTFYLGRNTPTMFNAHLLDVMFWDGHAAELADGSWLSPFGSELKEELTARFDYGTVTLQVLAPLTVSDEMLGAHGDNDVATNNVLDQDWSAVWDALTARVVATEGYRSYFEAAFPDIPFEEITIAEIADAIAAMEIEAYASADSPFDRFLAGDDAALDQAALVGGLAFADSDGANCVACHSGPLLSDLGYHNTLLAQFGTGKACGDAEFEPGIFDDFGYECTTADPADRYRFRTPPLRNLAVSGPYGHAGQYRSVEEFVSHYLDPAVSLAGYDPATDQDDPELIDASAGTSEAVAARPDPLLADVHLDEADIAPLVAFLASLDDPAMSDLGDYLPAEVPSGLPVDAPATASR